MNRGLFTIICFDYGGSYSKDGDEIRWVSEEDEIHTLVLKKSVEEVTYSSLITGICRKVKIDEANTQLKVSYFPLVVGCKKPSYIWNDENVFGYLMLVNNDTCRSVLHVEIVKDVDQNQGFVQPSREDPESENSASDDEVFPSGMDVNAAMITLHAGEPSEARQAEQTNFTREEVGDDEVGPGIEEVAVNKGWEDGIEISVGQEFRSKQAVQDLVHAASHQYCFEVDIIKSDKKRYVVKCREAKDGCKWSLRAAKVMESDWFSVRTYNKMHTCSRATSVTIRNKRKGTPGLVASVLHEDYPGKFDTPTPKHLMGMVQGRLGVTVSYSTALRGKKQAANDVRGSPAESYELVYSYMHMLESMNPGTKTYVELEENKRFKYLFFALGASIEGFQAMRKVIVVDGTHLKTGYGGVLIVATAQDPNHHHYPIAFGVVDGEKDDSWMWFLNKFKSVVPDDLDWCFFLIETQVS